MKRTMKFLGFGLLVTAVLALAIGGTALAATRNQDRTGDCTCVNGVCDGQQLRDGSCSDCAGDQLRLRDGSGDACVPNLYGESGPLGKRFTK